MATRVGCCLNLLPPSTTSSSPPSSIIPPPQVTWGRKEADTWKRQCVVGVACMTIGLGTCNINLNTNPALITETSKTPNLELAVVAESSLLPNSPSVNSNGQQRWSEKRGCPAWTVKSFELTVPENLPRPYTRRRWESVGSDTTTRPPIANYGAPSVTAKSNPNCFSM